ncbi:MAG: hypothetical protein ACOYMQ_05490 [Pseudanabaena sp.]
MKVLPSNTFNVFIGVNLLSTCCSFCGRAIATVGIMDRQKE